MTTAFYDRVGQEVDINNSTSTEISFSGATIGNRTFFEEVTPGRSTYVLVRSRDCTSWMICHVTCTLTGKLTINEVLESTNANEVLSLDDTKTYWCGTWEPADLKTGYVGNFAGSIPPSHPIDGQMWLDRSNPAHSVTRYFNAVRRTWLVQGDIGAVQFFAQPEADLPPGWIAANGQDVPRNDYVDLFAVLGEIYGAGDGTTTFTLPDLRGKYVAGLDSAHVLTSQFGSATATATGAFTATATTEFEDVPITVTGDVGGQTGSVNISGAVQVSGSAVASGNFNVTLPTTVTGVINVSGESDAHTLTEAQMPAHVHNISHSHPVESYTNFPTTTVSGPSIGNTTVLDGHNPRPSTSIVNTAGPSAPFSGAAGGNGAHSHGINISENVTLTGSASGNVGFSSNSFTVNSSGTFSDGGNFVTDAKNASLDGQLSATAETDIAGDITSQAFGILPPSTAMTPAIFCGR